MVEREERDCQCWSIWIPWTKRSILQTPPQLGATVRPSALLSGVESWGAFDLRGGTLSGTSTQSLQEELVGARPQSNLSL